MLKNGVHAKVVSERLGHSTIAITLGLYSHMLPGLQEMAAETLDALLSPGPADSTTDGCKMDASDAPKQQRAAIS